MSDPVSADPQKPRGWRRIFRGRFLVFSIIFHVLLGLVATYLVVQTLAPRKQTFKAGPKTTSSSQKSVEHQVQLAKKQKTMSAPAPAKRITTTGLSKVTLPEMPEMPTTDTPNKMQGMGAPGANLGLGSAGAAGSSGGAGSAMPFFGLKDGGRGLAGTFYDFKQSRSGKPNDLAIGEGKDGAYMSPRENGLNTTYSAIVAKVIDRGMSEGSISRYFTSPSPLYTTQIYIPTIQADEAPKAFNLAGKVQPRRWIVIYRGRVTPPEGGRYQFVGGADDLIAVRFNGRVVLNNRGPSKEKYAFDGLGAYPPVQSLDVGSSFEVKAGLPYEIQILIGEQPGGFFKAFLLLKKEGVEYAKDSKGNPLLPIFKLGPSSTKKTGEAPVIAPDTSWSIWKPDQSNSLLPAGFNP